MPDLSKLSHAELYQLREKQKGLADQLRLAPLEHRAFAREVTANNPLMALSLGAAIPLYSASKALGISKARTPANLDEITGGFTGIGEGLAEYVRKLRE